MWRDRIIQEKETLNITCEEMSDRIKHRIPGRTISRILSGETENPRIDTIIVLGEAVGLSPKELFADIAVFAADENVLATAEKLEEVKIVLEEVKETACLSEAERSQTAAETNVLKDKIAELTKEVELLRAQIKQKDNILKLVASIVNTTIFE